MPNAKPLILLSCWFAVALVTGVAIGLYPAFNIKLEPLYNVKELQCKTVITSDLNLVGKSDQIEAYLGFDKNNEALLFMNSVPDGPMLACWANEIKIKKDKIIYMLTANNKDGDTNGLSFFTFDNKLINNVFLCTNSKGDLCFGLSGENMSLLSGIGLSSNIPEMELSKTTDPRQILSINYYPPAGSGIYLEYPDQLLTFPGKKDNATKPLRIIPPLTGK